MSVALASILSVLLSGACYATFAIFQTAFLSIAYNIVTDGGATCNGTGDDAPNFKTFNTWARANQGTSLRVVLTIPAGSNCIFNSNQSIAGTTLLNAWAAGINDLVVEGTGATISGGTSSFYLGAQGIIQIGLTAAAGKSARLQTVSAGSSTITLTAASLSAGYISRFTVGNPVAITGIDTQGLFQSPFGFPPNPQRFEYRIITNVNAGAGVITPDRPLTNSYSSAWPEYNSGNNFEVDNGGPATAYAMNSQWNQSVEFRGLTIDQAGQTYANSRYVTYRNVTFAGANCGIPTQNEIWSAYNSTFTNCSMEVDKLIGTVILDNVTIKRIDFQSASTDLLQMTNSTVTQSMFGTPKSSIITDSTFAILRPGAYAYGISTGSIVCTRCNVTDFQPDQGGSGYNGVPQAWTMSSGLITFPMGLESGAGPPGRMFAPGGNYRYYTGGYTSIGGYFQASSLSGDPWPAADNQTITTNVTTTASSNVLTTSSSIFASGDVGKTILIPGAGGGGSTLSTAIIGFTSATQVTLYDNAGTSLAAASKQLQWGTANVYVQTSEAGGFPSLGALSGSDGVIYIGAHVAPQWTCDACTGDDDIIATNTQNGATPGAPLQTYSKRSYAPSGASANLGTMYVRGNLVSLTIDVTQAYTGTGNGRLNATGQFHLFTVDQTGMTQYDWVPLINLKTAGTRVITPSGVTCNGSPGACSGDACTQPAAGCYALPSAVWIQNAIAPSTPDAMSGGGTLPQFTITVVADQHVVP